MKRQITVSYPDGERIVEAFDTGVPGIVVNEDPDYGWLITHVLTGLHLGYRFDSPEHAMYAASLLRGLDWLADPLTYRKHRYAVKVVEALGTTNCRNQTGDPVIRNEP